MRTYLLSDADVRRYVTDFVLRWRGMGDTAPTYLVALGVSGDKLLEEMIKIMGFEEFEALNCDIVRLGFNRSTKQVVEREGSVPVAGRSVLIIDSAVHSGASIRHVADSTFGSRARPPFYPIPLS